MATETTGTDAATAEGTGTPATGEGATGTAAATAVGVAAVPLTPEQIAELQASNARLMKALEAEREGNKEIRRQRSEEEKAKLTGQEQVAAELEELREAEQQWAVERAELTIEREIGRLGPKLGILDPEVTAALIDWDDLEFDDDGKPTNVEDVVRALIAKKPMLAGKPSDRNAPRTDSGQGTGGGTPPSLTAAELTAAQSAGISPERYDQLKKVRTLKDWQSTQRKAGG